MTTFIGDDAKPRCSWCAQTAEYIDYHDNEWGYPVVDDQRLFEKICLEGFQSGLSWLTILKKRENFRSAFDHFDFHKMAAYTQEDVERLVQDAGIIRHRGKIEAVINNAKRVIELIEETGSFATYVWTYEPAERPEPGVVRATSPESVAMSKDLKKRGWKFVGPTTVYAFMQAMGMVNDHDPACWAYDKSEQLRRDFIRPA